MAQKRHEWHITDPNHILTNTRRLVKAYKGLGGFKTEAEALAALVAAGYQALQEQTNEKAR